MMYHTMPWVDVIISLAAPPWAQKVIQKIKTRRMGLWKALLITDQAIEGDESNFIIRENFSKTLSEAHRRAKEKNRTY